MSECGAAGGKPFGLDETPPKVEQDNRDVDMAAVGPVQHRPEDGTDTSVGIWDDQIPG